MKLSLAITIFAASLVDKTFACEANARVVQFLNNDDVDTTGSGTGSAAAGPGCFVNPNCDASGGLFDVVMDTDGNAPPMDVQACLTNNAFGRTEGMEGAGVGGGGGSCLCEEPDGTIACATFDSINRNTGTLTASFVNSRANDGAGRSGSKTVPLIRFPVYVNGDPHIKAWSGKWYDWHGQCDNVMLHAPNFAHGMGLDIHTRSKIRYDYSFIETVAIRLGEDVLEVSSYGQFFVNGVDGAEVEGISDFPLVHDVKGAHDHLFTINLGHTANITINTHNDIVGIGLDMTSNDLRPWFYESTGLMGSFETGELLARDGETVLSDPNAMGQEWQVLDTEPKLFQNTEREPQYPTKCLLPSPSAKETRRLGETISREAAEMACKHWKTTDAMERCIYDVIAVGDLEMATAGTY